MIPRCAAPLERLTITLQCPLGARALRLFFEWYGALPGPTGVVVTAAAFARAEPPRAVRRRYGPAAWQETPQGLRIGRCLVGPEGTRGELRAGAQTITWDLGLTASAAGAETQASGTFTVDQVHTEVQRWHAVVDRRRGFDAIGVRAVAQGLSGDPKGRFEALALRPRFLGLGLPGRARAALRYHGRWWRFSGPVAPPLAGLESADLRWRFVFPQGPLALSGEVSAEPFEAGALLAQAPSGAVLYTLHGALARCVLTLTENGRSTPLEASRASLELTTPDAAHGLLVLG